MRMGLNIGIYINVPSTDVIVTVARVYDETNVL